MLGSELPKSKRVITTTADEFKMSNFYFPETASFSFKRNPNETVKSPLIRSHSPYLNPSLLAEHTHKKGRRLLKNSDRNLGLLSSTSVGCNTTGRQHTTSASLIDDDEHLT